MGMKHGHAFIYKEYLSKVVLSNVNRLFNWRKNSSMNCIVRHCSQSRKRFFALVKITVVYYIIKFLIILFKRNYKFVNVMDGAATYKIINWKIVFEILLIFLHKNQFFFHCVSLTRILNTLYSIYWNLLII